MMIFTNNKCTKFCQIALRTKRFIHKRKVVPFFLPHGAYTPILAKWHSNEVAR